MSSAPATLNIAQDAQPRSFLRRLGQWLADWPNPIVVKELRQAVRGWTALVMFLLYLVVQLVVVGIMLMSVAEQIWSESPVGAKVFLAVQIQLAITIVGLLPLYAGTRLFLERSDVNLDLMFITPLRPVWLVLGKLLAALVLGLLFFSASAPVMTMAYFLRGLDLFYAGILLGLDVLAMMTAVQAALFVAAIPAARAIAVLLGLGAVFGLLFGVAMLTSGSVAMFVGPGSVAPEVVIVVSSIVALTLVASFILLFTATHALLSPPPSNRLMPFKIMLLVVPIAYWIGVLGLVELFSRLFGSMSSNEYFELIGIMERTIAVTGWLAWCIAVSERLEWNRRVLAQVPRSRWLRVLAFPFYSGAANGLTLALVLTIFSLLTRRLMGFWLSWSGTSWQPFKGFFYSYSPDAWCISGSFYSSHTGLFYSYIPDAWLEWEFIAFMADCYVIAYALTALMLRRYLEWQRGKLVPGWVLLLLEVGLIGFASVLVAVVLSLLRVPENLLTFAFVFTPYAVFEALGMELLYRHGRWDVYLFSTVLVLTWLAIVGSVTFYWWWDKIRRFAPPPQADSSRTPAEATPNQQRAETGGQSPVTSGQ